MKNSILSIVGITAVTTIMTLIFYNPLTDYYRYTVPIKNSEIVSEYTHVDSFPIEGINHTRIDTIFDLTLIDNQTIKLQFRNYGPFLPPWPIKDFEDFEREFNIGDSFVTHCWQDPDNTSHLTFFQFNGTRQVDGELFIDLIHGTASSKELIPCNYPQIIDYSTNVFELR